MPLAISIASTSAEPTALAAAGSAPAVAVATIATGVAALDGAAALTTSANASSCLGAALQHARRALQSGDA